MYQPKYTYKDWRRYNTHMPERLSLIQRRTIDRRNCTYKRAYNQTIDRGRPNRSIFGQCRSKDCKKCGYKDFSRHLELYDEDYEGTRTSHRQDLLFEAMIAHFWDEVPPVEKEKARRKKAIESFVHSPPLKGAFAQFQVYMDENDLGMSGETEDIAAALTEHRETFITYVTALWNYTLDQDAEHAEFFQRPRHISKVPKHWAIDKFILQLFLVAESWRLFSYRHQGATMWRFPSATVEKMVDFLSAVLLNYTCLWNNGAMRLVSLDKSMHNEDWGQWDDEYQVFAEELHRRTEKDCRSRQRDRLILESRGRITEEDLKAALEGKETEEGGDGEECFEGFGLGADADSWMTKRIRSSSGWKVPGYKP